MFDTVIKYNLLNKEDIDFLNKNLITEEYVMNPSAEKDSDSVIHTCNIKHLKNVDVFKIIKNIDNKLFSIIEEIYKLKILKVAGTCIAKYTEGKFIGTHKDWQENDDWVVKNNLETVHLSCVFYINDNYSGGELCFYDNQNNVNKLLEFKPSAGSAIFFDALQVHGTNPIINGIKYSYTNFYTVDLLQKNP
jgi:predicted 2-oxoglutarate/Fe(II)-dependent dioxygenase YbiX